MQAGTHTASPPLRVSILMFDHLIKEGLDSGLVLRVASKSTWKKMCKRLRLGKSLPCGSSRTNNRQLYFFSMFTRKLSGSFFFSL